LISLDQGSAVHVASKSTVGNIYLHLIIPHGSAIALMS
jgi:hypothetical protein